MTESILLLKCKQSIQNLNEVILTQKQSISKLITQNAALNSQNQQNKIINTTLKSQITKLKKNIMEEKSRGKNEVHIIQNKLIFEQKLHESEVTDYIKKIEQLQIVNQSQKKQIKQNGKLIQEWQHIMQQINTKIQNEKKEKKQLQIRLKQENLRLQNECLLYKNQIEELKLECKQLYQKQEGSNQSLVKLTQSLRLQIQQAKRNSEQLKQKCKINLQLQKQNQNNQQIINNQNKTISKYENHIVRLQNQINNLNKILSHHKISKNYFKQLKVNNQSTFRNGSIDLKSVDNNQKKKKSNNISLDQQEQIKSQNLKPNKEESSKKTEAIAKLSKLQSKVRQIMKQIRQ